MKIAATFHTTYLCNSQKTKFWRAASEFMECIIKYIISFYIIICCHLLYNVLLIVFITYIDTLKIYKSIYTIKLEHNYIFTQIYMYEKLLRFQEIKNSFYCFSTILLYYIKILKLYKSEVWYNIHTTNFLIS